MPTSLTKQTVRLAANPVRHGPDMENPAWAAWQAQVDAGRIGKRPQRSVEQRIKMMRKEIVLFGRVVTPELETF